MGKLTPSDGQLHEAEEKHVNARWSGSKPGKRFRCRICGHKILLGEKFVFCWSGRLNMVNFFACETCWNKCPSMIVLVMWAKQCFRDSKKKYWYLHDDIQDAYDAYDEAQKMERDFRNEVKDHVDQFAQNF